MSRPSVAAWAARAMGDTRSSNTTRPPRRVQPGVRSSSTTRRSFDEARLEAHTYVLAELVRETKERKEERAHAEQFNRARPEEEAVTEEATPKEAPPPSKGGFRPRPAALKRVLTRCGAKALTPAMKHNCYMGNHPALLKQYQDTNVVKTAALRAYFRTDGSAMWAKFEIGELSHLEFNHIVPSQDGGPHHPLNYFAMPAALNQAEEFKYICLEKKEYIGPTNVKTVPALMGWLLQQANKKMFRFAESRELNAA